MSWRALSHALAHVASVPMSGPARLVLVALANRHNQETGRCDPSNAMLCKDTQYSERAVRAALRELEALKLITTEERVQRTGRGRRHMTNRYRLKGGAQSAGGVGHNMPPKQELSPPSAFDDLAFAIECPGEEGQR